MRSSPRPNTAGYIQGVKTWLSLDEDFENGGLRLLLLQCCCGKGESVVVGERGVLGEHWRGVGVPKEEISPWAGQRDMASTQKALARGHGGICDGKRERVGTGSRSHSGVITAFLP